MVALLLSLALAVAFCAVAGGIWALLKQQVVVDQNGAPSEIEVPGFGKLRTNYPSLVAIALGILLAWSVQSRLSLVVTVPTVPLNAKLKLEGMPEGSQIYVSAVPQKYLRAASATTSAEDSEITINVDDAGEYNVVAFTVTGLTQNNKPIYRVVYGPAKLNAEPKSLEFIGSLGWQN